MRIRPEEPKPMGRPPLEPSQRRLCVLRPTFTELEHQAIVERAEASGEAPSAYLRRIALSHIKFKPPKEKETESGSPFENADRANRLERLREMARMEEE